MKRTATKVMALAMLIAGSLLLAAASSGWLSKVPDADRKRVNPFAGQADAIAAGQILFQNNCAKCHGKDGKGNTPTGKKLHVKDYTDAKVQASMTDADMTKIIKEGKKEGDATKMKAYSELSDADVKALVAYIRAFKS